MHGGLIGLIGLLFGLLFWASLPLWNNIVFALGVVPFGMMGGRLAAGNRQRIDKDTIAELGAAADGGAGRSSQS